MNVSRHTIYTDNPDREETSRWKNFKLYSLWNAIRFILIASLVCASNYYNQIESETYRKYCCDCYYIAIAPEQYGINPPIKIDWSFCFPDCVDCTYCKEQYQNNTSELLQINNETCAADLDTPMKRTFKWNWDENCPSNLSMTTLNIFSKDYRIYGVAIVIVVILYIFLMIAFVFCCKSYAAMNSGAALLVYNVIVSIHAVYSMFKPMQYYHKSITHNTPKEIICEVDTINETIEDIITYCVYASFAFILTQWLMGVIGCIITRKAMGSRKKGSVGRVPYKIKMAYIQFEKAMIVLAVILGVFFYLTLIYASGVMIDKRVKEHRGEKAENDIWKIAVILIVDLLAILSCFDIFCFTFCIHTFNNYFGRNVDKTDQKTYRQLLGSMDESTAPSSVPLLRDDEKQTEL
eukprot:299644_1